VDWFGITHHVPYRLLPLWRRLLCKRGWHAWDEVQARTHHYLYCDACNLMVDISNLNTDYLWEKTPKWWS
jgi:hypothetical protein